MNIFFAKKRNNTIVLKRKIICPRIDVLIGLKHGIGFIHSSHFWIDFKFYSRKKDIFSTFKRSVGGKFFLKRWYFFQTFFYQKTQKKILINPSMRSPIFKSQSLRDVIIWLDKKCDFFKIFKYGLPIYQSDFKSH